MEKQNPKKPANPIQLRSLGWVDEELAMVQDQYSATLSAINFPCYTQSSSKTKDYQVVVDGKDYGMVREINCGNRFEYRASWQTVTTSNQYRTFSTLRQSTLSANWLDAS